MNDDHHSTPLLVHVGGIGLLGPGLPDWATGRALLHDPAGWRSAPTVLQAPAKLPPAERRRAGAIVKLSVGVAEQACAEADVDPRSLITVFSASSGDAANCHALCEALAAPQRMVSPTRFTNSVHNASAGYWHIAAGSRAPSTSLCAYDASFGAGLLEAVSQCAAFQRPVLLVTGDVPYPEPLNRVRPLPDAFGIALVLAPQPGPHDAGRFSLRLAEAGRPASVCAHPGLEALRRALSAARGLPLLQALGGAVPAEIVLADPDGVALALQVVPAGRR